MKIAIIGGGLAGCAAAYVLKQAGAEPVIYEAGSCLAGKASGNEVGLVNPRFSAFHTPESDYFTSALSGSVRAFSTFEGIGWNPCGSLHLITDEKREKRFTQTVENWRWPADQMRLVRAGEASDIAGVPLTHDALYLPAAGAVSPRLLCEFYASEVEVRLNHPVEDIAALEEEFVILACGTGIRAFEEAAPIPLQHVRGQVTKVRASAVSEKLRCNLCYGGYLSPAQDGAHMLGATFQRWLDHDDIIAEDDGQNIDSLCAVAPELSAGLSVEDHRAGVRVSAKDHFPVVGALDPTRGLYISAAHGSHGIISSLAAAHLLADMMLGRPLSQSSYTVHALSPQRFEDTN